MRVGVGSVIQRPVICGGASVELSVCSTVGRVPFSSVGRPVGYTGGASGGAGGEGACADSARSSLSNEIGVVLKYVAILNNMWRRPSIAQVGMFSFNHYSYAA